MSKTQEVAATAEAKKPRAKELPGDAGKIKSMFYKFKKLASMKLDAKGNLAGYDFRAKSEDDKIEYLLITKTSKDKDGNETTVKIEGADALQESMSRYYAVFGGRIEKYGSDERHKQAKETLKGFIQASLKEGKPDLNFQKENAQVLLDQLMAIYEPTGERKKSTGSNLEAVTFEEWL